MNKLLSLITASTLMLAAGFAVAGERSWNAQDRDRYAQNVQEQGDTDRKEAEYLAALKKCEAIREIVERQACIEAAKRKYGQM